MRLLPQPAAATSRVEVQLFCFSPSEYQPLMAQDEAATTSWSQSHKWHIPCYIKPHAHPTQPASPVTPAQSSSRQSPSPSRRGHSQGRSKQPLPLQQQQEAHATDDKCSPEELEAPQVVHLDVSTCAVLPVLAVQGEGSSWRPEHGVWELDFGMLPASKSVITSLTGLF